jgi:hypothetical protein
LTGNEAGRERANLVLQIIIEDRHLKLIGGLTLVIVAKDHADKLLIDEDLGGVLLARTLAHLELRVPEHSLQIALKLENLFPSHRSSPIRDIAFLLRRY